MQFFLMQQIHLWFLWSGPKMFQDILCNYRAWEIGSQFMTDTSQTNSTFIKSITEIISQIGGKCTLDLHITLLLVYFFMPTLHFHLRCFKYKRSAHILKCNWGRKEAHFKWCTSSALADDLGYLIDRKYSEVISVFKS